MSMPDLLSVIEVIRAANGGCILPLNRAENTLRLVLLSCIPLLISKLNIVQFRNCGFAAWKPIY